MLWYPLQTFAQSRSVIKPIIELSLGEDLSLFAPAETDFKLKTSSFSGGLEVTGQSSKLIAKAGVSRDNMWGYHLYFKGVDDYPIGYIYFGVEGKLFLDNRTEKVFSSLPAPSLEFDGQTEKRFLLLGFRIGLGNNNKNYFRALFNAGAGQIILTNKLYVAGRLTDDFHGFSREDLLPFGGLGLEGGFVIWNDIRLNGNYINLMTSNLIPDRLNTEKLFPFKNQVVEMSLDIYKSNYLELGLIGSWAEYPYGPTVSQRSAGIKIGLWPKKYN